MTNLWLLAPEVLERIGSARARHVDSPAALAWEMEAAEGERRAEREGLPRNMTVVGSTAEIRVSGVLTKRPDYFAEIFGGGNATYSSIRSALALAASDPKIRSIVLAVDSPGGDVNGLFETLEAIASIRATSGKQIRVRGEQAQSAAYGIAAAAGPIEAVTRGAMFGSIGVAASYWVMDDIVTITNTDSPDKRPDVTTDEGRAVVQRELDLINDEFVRAIARGRGVTAAAVTSGYGRGASFTAPKALELGMIDRIASTPLRAVNTKGKSSMDDNDARASAADVEAAVQRGITQERDRVLYHLQMGEASGEMAIALEAIRAGTGKTLEIAGRYESAAVNRLAKVARQAESDAAAAKVAGASTPPPAADIGDAVVENMKASNRSFVRG